MATSVTEFLIENFTSTLGEDFSDENVTDLNNATTRGIFVKAQFPKDMLGFTAACAFIIAILGTSGKLLVFS